jgi:hypothetical protein
MHNQAGIRAHDAIFADRLSGCDVDGMRTLKIENPFTTFKPMEPTLPMYLMQRNNNNNNNNNNLC